MADTNFHKPDNTPSSAFYFAVKFIDFPEMDSSFQEVSGLKVTLGMEEKKEGGKRIMSLIYLL